MKRFIFIQFTFGAVIIGAIAVMMFVLHGFVGMALYLAFAAVCLTPAMLKARAIVREEKEIKKHDDW